MLFGGDRKSGLAPRISSAVTASSTPPGERGSSRTVPVIATLVSCVSRPKAAHVSSDTSFLDTTPCTLPVPSLSTTNAIFPLDRVVTTQPRTMTVSPTCSRSSLIRTAVMPIVSGGLAAGSVPL